MLLTGAGLRQIFSLTSPFTADGRLKPENERVTLLAANANFPLELQFRAFAMAGALGDGSPIIVQMSQNAAEAAAGDPGKVPPLQGVKHYNPDTNVVLGAQLAAQQLTRVAREYNAPYLALSLDHFKVPAFSKEKLLARLYPTQGLSHTLAEARLGHVLEHMLAVFGEEAVIDADTREAYCRYFTGQEYLVFKRDFVRVVELVRPAWGMIDTEQLPPVLDFLVTRDIRDTVRHTLGNDEIIIEAEFGATGTSGQALDYQKFRGKELEQFAAKVVSFIRYTGADAIAYPIGMEHAAKKDSKHEPDVERIEVVQSALYRSLGRYIPFAQHGGSGAAKIARGLVGKNNVNTYFLVAGSSAVGEYAVTNIDSIRAGDKKYCGPAIFTQYMQAVAMATRDKLAETGSLNLGSMLQAHLPVLDSFSRESLAKPMGDYDE
ncbi:MAG: hypothetical protein DDT35_01299 [Firmicutes bacterium]|nr:hypothetical protein [Bacillota bacterium]